MKHHLKNLVSLLLFFCNLFFCFVETTLFHPNGKLHIRLFPLSMPVRQMLWVWCVSLPVTLLNSTEVNPGWTARDVAGLVMFVVGFFFEFVGDIQKDIFKVGVRDKATTNCVPDIYIFFRAMSKSGNF